MFAQYVHIDQPQTVMDQTQQDVREFQTTLIVESIQEHPEMQMRQMVWEVLQIVHETVEQIVNRLSRSTKPYRGNVFPIAP